jgi:Tol biopolymer transport system component
VVYPTGPGQKTQIDVGGRDISLPIRFLPDGTSVFVSGRDADGAPTAWYLDLDTGSWTPVATTWPATIRSIAASPDGSTLLVCTLGGATQFLPLDGGAAKAGPTLQADELLVEYASDGKTIFVAQHGIPLAVTKLNLESGAREPFLALAPADSGGVTRVFHVCLALDGEAYAYGYSRVLSDLYIGDGLLR